MDLSTYIKDSGVRQRLADECGTSPAYLWQIAKGWRGRKASVDLAKKIVAASGGVVTLRDLRPDIYAEPSALQRTA